MAASTSIMNANRRIDSIQYRRLNVLRNGTLHKRVIVRFYGNA
jgi:hypothetical protein